MIGLYSRKRFSPCLPSPAASCREILKIVINWMLSGENWPIRVGRSAFPAPEVFIGVIDLPAKRELIGLSVSRSASRRDFIAETPVRREFLYTVLSDINPFVSRGQLIENVISNEILRRSRDRKSRGKRAPCARERYRGARAASRHAAYNRP